MLDLCCATGDHIADLLTEGQQGIGIDFSLPFLQEARKKEMPGITLLASDARALPLANESTGTVYSLSALYLVPDLDKVIKEIARVLMPGGRCILDLGNRDSLNSYCVRNYYTELPMSYHLPVSEMVRLCESNSLRVIEHRAFQILPLWAGRPRWLWPLLHPGWKRLMSNRIKGRMIDEWISGCKLLRRFAFRQLLVCEKARQQENH
ncbi:MAG TPA: class I SAM-dependent methyltransferase [Methylophilaceae bacterium]|nr:class I SAM-dependent methyltransferase [Methylophilaceae bacterium]